MDADGAVALAVRGTQGEETSPRRGPAEGMLWRQASGARVEEEDESCRRRSGRRRRSRSARWSSAERPVRVQSASVCPSADTARKECKKNAQNGILCPSRPYRTGVAAASKVLGWSPIQAASEATRHAVVIPKNGMNSALSYRFWLAIVSR